MSMHNAQCTMHKHNAQAQCTMHTSTTHQPHINHHTPITHQPHINQPRTLKGSMPTARDKSKGVTIPGRRELLYILSPPASSWLARGVCRVVWAKEASEATPVLFWSGVCCTLLLVGLLRLRLPRLASAVCGRRLLRVPPSDIRPPRLSRTPSGCDAEDVGLLLGVLLSLSLLRGLWSLWSLRSPWSLWSLWSPSSPPYSSSSSNISSSSDSAGDDRRVRVREEAAGGRMSPVWFVKQPASRVWTPLCPVFPVFPVFDPLLCLCCLCLPRAPSRRP